MQKIPIPSQLTQFTDEELEQQKLSMWLCHAALITPSINSVVEFAKRIPGNFTFLISLKQTLITPSINSVVEFAKRIPDNLNFLISFKRTLNKLFLVI